MSWPWSGLGLDGPAPLPEIKRAYAQRLKTTHPEENPEGFQRLYSAYKAACRLAKKGHGSSHDTATSHTTAWEVAWEYESPQGHDAPPSEAKQKQQQPDWDYDRLFEDRDQTPPEKKRETKQPDWDYDRLLENGKQAPQKKQETGQPDWDYDRLLEDGNQTPPEKERETKQPDWDYDRLLENREQAPQKKQETEQPDWDYDRLFEDRDQTPPEKKRERKQPDWDYDRLFHQAQAEEDETYLRRRDALRKKYWIRYRSWPRNNQEQTESDGEAWLRVLSALRRIEWLRITGAPSDIWKQFFSSDLFVCVMRNPDFLFGLEEFLSAHPELSDEVRGTIRTAYAFLNGNEAAFIKWYGPLLRLLRSHPPKKQRKAWLLWKISSICFLVFLSSLAFFDGKQTEDKKNFDSTPQSTDSHQYHSVTYTYKIDRAFEKIGEHSFYDERIEAFYEFTTDLGVDEESALLKLTQRISDYRVDETFERYEFAYSDEKTALVPLTAADGAVYRHTILSLYFTEDGHESAIHFGIALSENGVLVTVTARHANSRDAETVKENIVHILKSTVLSNPDAITEENYRSLFHLAEEYGYEHVGYGYIKIPYERFGRNAFEGVYIPYTENVEYLEDGYAIRSSAHGVEIYHMTARSKEDARAVVEQAYETLVASGVEIFKDGVYETVHVEEYDIAYKQVAYFEENGEKERLAFLFAKSDQTGYYHYTQITYLPEHMDEDYPELVMELSDALTLSLPQP